MKKIVLMMLVILVGLHVKATYLPCVLNKTLKNMPEFKNEVMYSTDPFMKNQVWVGYIEIIAQAMQTSNDPKIRAEGMNLRPDASGIQFVLSHSSDYDPSYVEQSDYENGARKDGTLVYTNLAGVKGRYVGFKYGDVEVIYAKLPCANPQKKKNPTRPYVPPVSPPSTSGFTAMETTNESQQWGCVNCYSGMSYGQPESGDIIIENKNVTIGFNFMYNGGYRSIYNEGNSMISPTGKVYHGNPAGVPGHAANSGNPVNVNGFPVITLNPGNPVGVGGNTTFNPFGADGFAAYESNWR